MSLSNTHAETIRKITLLLHVHVIILFPFSQLNMHVNVVLYRGHFYCKPKGQITRINMHEVCR